ncbi:hypothetical protein ACKWTF_010074 [Chironomus riparius]
MFNRYKRMLRIVALLFAFLCCACSHVIVQEIPTSQLAHPSVINTQYFEHQFPAELVKSAKFYSNPKTASRLAQESWFTDKESPVFDREAEKIERHEISKIFVNAGLHRRRRQA